MTALKFCANISWLFTELPELSERLRAAACAGFQAVEAAWLYGSDLRELQKVREETGLQVALINTPPGKSAREHEHTHTHTHRQRPDPINSLNFTLSCLRSLPILQSVYSTVKVVPK